MRQTKVIANRTHLIAIRYAPLNDFQQQTVKSANDPTPNQIPLVLNIDAPKAEEEGERRQKPAAAPPPTPSWFKVAVVGVARDVEHGIAIAPSNNHRVFHPKILTASIYQVDTSTHRLKICCGIWIHNESIDEGIKTPPDSPSNPIHEVLILRAGPIRWRIVTVSGNWYSKPRTKTLSILQILLVDLRDWLAASLTPVMDFMKFSISNNLQQDRVHPEKEIHVGGGTTGKSDDARTISNLAVLWDLGRG